MPHGHCNGAVASLLALAVSGAITNVRHEQSVMDALRAAE
jgi:hypothetical protein